ncbi:MAG: tripartite tricarboxylate transporter substrate binding protein [Deltaproteobacteria bacterium]|jgi:tripartite-type tricarboxylate transporter receptor subunit TctC|nr:tripartite tricarboxylate transporter substrate binding protein [Deltaproteobacteria bacterium]
MKKLFLLLACAVLLLPLPNASAAWPERPIRLIVAFPPGGGSDTFCRLTAPLLEKELGVRVIVNNMPSGTGASAMAYVWNAAHDGYTWCSANTTQLGIPVATGIKTTAKDWSYYIAGGGINMIFVSKESGIKNLDEFLAAARQPEKFVFATPAMSGVYWDLELIKKNLNLPVKIAAYAGAADAILAVLSGETTGALFSMTEVQSHVQAGTLIPIAVVSQDQPLMVGNKSIPPLSSSAPEWEARKAIKQFQGYVLPADIPQEAATRINAAFLKIMDSPELAAVIEEWQWQRYGLFGKAAAEFAANLESALSYIQYDLGLAKFSPETFGIKRIE